MQSAFKTDISHSVAVLPVFVKYLSTLFVCAISASWGHGPVDLFVVSTSLRSHATFCTSAFSLETSLVYTSAVYRTALQRASHWKHQIR